MILQPFTCLAALASLSAAAILPKDVNSSFCSGTSTEKGLTPGCQHGPQSRQCWGRYDINTNWYDVTPYTGVTREYWLEAVNITASPDGFEQYVLAFNGTIPGPTIFADWGDDVIVHVTNKMPNNGTSIHWHGVRQYLNNENDGVPGVTQCPIAPGETYTYKWRATQYGSSWYHSHFSFQYSMGLQGAIIINGPATADYDEDLGALFMQDWAHIDPFNEWWWDRPTNGPPAQQSALINGTNVFNCPTNGTSPRCLGTGKRFEMNFESGKKYRLRIINTGLYSNFRFAIDGHQLTVIGMDFVPLVPYTTDNVIISMGQRYDIIIEANAPPADYWLRPIWQRSCCDNDVWNNTLGIVRYNSRSTALPTSTNPATLYPDACDDEPYYKLSPWVPLSVPAPKNTWDVKPLNLYYEFVPMPAGFLFTLNNSYIWVNFSQPTNLLLTDGVPESNFTNTGYNPVKGFTDYSAFPITVVDDWVYFALQDISHRNRSHPMHLHGHDYYVLAQGSGNFTNLGELNLVNPPRRDVATLPSNGHMVMAFKTDNPGSWLMHCHIAAHSSEGLGLQFIEREKEIVGTFKAESQLNETCRAWGEYWAKDQIYVQEDSGI
ncbi:laccase 2 [Mollisia scopiformis]|uniref:laccase n=1 Tax=Mollisia scopiformis TaxID=149040 RepID=A0A194WUC3_MOLSC|nr:laccase 2 [Mollisia scopiformis]KUJ11561.1 laccase 2 [Mollisia scopiformis]